MLLISESKNNSYIILKETVGECEKSALRDLISKSNRRALWISSFAMVVKQMTGGWAIVSFAGPLMMEGGQPYGTASFIVGASKLMTSAVTIILVLRFGIKKLVILSMVGITASLVSIFYLNTIRIYITR